MFGKMFQTLLTGAGVPELYDPRVESQSDLKLTTSLMQQIFIESLKSNSYYTFCQFKLHIQPAQYICLFHLTFTINSDSFPTIAACSPSS